MRRSEQSVRGVEVSELELGTDGGITVRRLAALYEDGEVVGASYLASSLRKSVEARGPMDLERVVRLYNSGYYGASWIDKGRVYLKEGQEAPVGLRVIEGPRGGRYYETSAGRGRPLDEAPADWTPKEGERVRLRMPGSRLNGRLGKIRENHHDKATGRNFSVIDGIGWTGGAYANWDEGRMVPAPYTAKEKTEMTARDILIQEFGKTIRRGGEEKGIRMQVFDGVTELEYDVFETEAGPELWIRAAPGKDKPWAVTKESAVSLEAFMKALPEMSGAALQDMKDTVRRIVFSPVPNPSDRKTSQMIGTKFTSAASMVMRSRVMHIYPKSKEVNEKALAAILTHETGHALDDGDANLSIVYNEKRRAWWADKQNMPTDDASIIAIEEEHGIPPHPRAWMDGYSKWVDFDLGTSHPDIQRYWRALGVTRPWNDLNMAEQIAVRKSTNGTAPVSRYANTSEKEYYAEAYMVYQEGRLPEGHIMQEHFENMEETRRWIYE